MTIWKDKRIMYVSSWHPNNLRLVHTFPSQNGRMLIHWAALGGHDDLVRHLLSLDVPVDPTDDVSKLLHIRSAELQNFHFMCQLYLFVIFSLLLSYKWIIFTITVNVTRLMHFQHERNLLLHAKLYATVKRNFIIKIHYYKIFNNDYEFSFTLQEIIFMLKSSLYSCISKKINKYISTKIVKPTVCPLIFIRFKNDQQANSVGQRLNAFSSFTA